MTAAAAAASLSECFALRCLLSAAENVLAPAADMESSCHSPDRIAKSVGRPEQADAADENRWGVARE